MASTELTLPAEDNKKLAVFNAGVAKAIRLDNIITKFNNASISPFCYDYEMHTYNYKIMFESLKRLFMEAVGKMDAKEINACEMQIIGLEYFMNKYPIIETDQNNKRNIIMNMQNWEIFKKNLDELEADIRIVLDEHDLDSPSKKKYMGL